MSTSWCSGGLIRYSTLDCIGAKVCELGHGTKGFRTKQYPVNLLKGVSNGYEF